MPKANTSTIGFVIPMLIARAVATCLLLTSTAWAQHPSALLDPNVIIEEHIISLRSDPSEAAANNVSVSLTAFLKAGRITVEDADQYYQRYEKYAKPLLSSKIVQAHLSLTKGHIMAYKEQPESMVKARFDEAITAATEYGDPQMMITLSNRAASYYFDKEQYDKALPYYIWSIGVIRENVQPNNEHLSTFNTLGMVFGKLGMPDSAILYLEQGIAYAQHYDRVGWEGLLSGSLASVYMDIGETSKAIPLFKADIAYSLADGMKISAANALSAVAEAYYTSYPDTAQLLLDSAQRLTSQFPKEIETMQSIYMKKIELFELIDQPDSTILYLHKLVQINDSIYHSRKREELDDLKEKYALVDAARSLQLMKSEQWITQYTIYFMAVVLATLAIAAAILYNRQLILNRSKKLIDAQKKDLQAANQEKDKLLAIISHDLRAPISSLSGMLSLMQIDMLTQEEFNIYIPDVQRQLTALGDTLENLLTWSRNQIDRTGTDMAALEVRSLVDSIYDLYHGMASSKGVILVRQYDTQAKALADPSMISMIIRNLVNNAIKFTHAGGKVQVTVLVEGRHLWIKVTDTGTGIDPAQLQRIQQSHEIPSTQGTSGEKGTGLGIRLCMEMAAKNGGALHINSIPDQGTTAAISLRIAEVD